MKTAFDPIAEIATDAARAALPEQVQVGGVTPLPRGADPFVGTDRPLLLAATRWTAVAPGGALLGGSPAAMAAVLGFDVPAAPTPVAPEDRKPDDPAPPKWADLIAEAARESATTVTQAIASKVAEVASLPPDVSTTQVSMNDSDAQVRAEVGPIPDAAVVMLHSGEHEVRLVVVVPGVLIARLSGTEAPQTETAAAESTEAEAAANGPAAKILRGELDRALAAVPLELSIGMGHANVPLAQVLHLQDGEVLELEEAVDAPVDLVSGSTPVAHGDLEVSELGTLVLHVTDVPGRPAAGVPTLVADPPPADGDEPADPLLRAQAAAGGADSAADAGDEPAADALDPADAALREPAPPADVTDDNADDAPDAPGHGDAPPGDDAA